MKNWIFVLVLAAGFVGCKKECEVKNENKVEGLAVSTNFGVLPITNEYRANRYFWFTKQEDAPRDMVVSLNNGVSYDPVDFTTYDVLGYHAVGYCEVSFQGVISKKEETKIISYTLEVEECGDCEIRRERMNWVLIPKVEAGYSVQFN